MNASIFKSFAIAAASIAIQSAHAGNMLMDSDVDPQFRAKLMKEKVKMNNQQGNAFTFTNASEAQTDSECGSQNIGNINTNGKIGTGPREVFVFAPNAMNFAGQGCK